MFLFDHLLSNFFFIALEIFMCGEGKGVVGQLTFLAARKCLPALKNKVFFNHQQLICDC